MIGQLPRLGHNVLDRPTLLRTPNTRYDAVAAELVAADHDPDQGLAAVRPQVRVTVRIEAGVTLRNPRAAALGPAQADLQTRSAARFDFPNERSDPVQLARADYEINVRNLLQYQLLVLLGQATQHADDGSGMAPFGLLQPSQRAVDLVFGMLPDTAGAK